MSETKSKRYFEKETDLCASFLNALRLNNAQVQESRNPRYDAHDWTPYAETAGWDILLVSKSDGTQIGIEAKLKLNVDVLLQSLDFGYDGYADTGPDFRAILVPSDRTQNGVGAIARHLGVTVIRQTPARENVKWSGGVASRYSPDRYSPDLPRQGAPFYNVNEWSNWLPNKRHKLPDYVPDVAAGDSAPMQLSEWKIQALRLCVILDERPVTRADFKALKISPLRWTQFWLQKTELGYVRCKKTPDFASQHPTIYKQIVAEKEEWMPAAVPLAMRPSPTQGVLIP